MNIFHPGVVKKQLGHRLYSDHALNLSKIYLMFEVNIKGIRGEGDKSMKFSFSSRAMSLIIVMMLLTTAFSVVALVAVDAATQTQDNITYTVSGGKATVTGYTGTGGAVNIPATLGGNPTVTIGTSAFKGTTITSVVIPDSVTTIGAIAFDRCAGLTSITIGSGVTNIGTSAFYFCNALSSVVIPNSVTSIGNYAFNHCAALASVTFGNSLTSIGTYAFADCYSLTTVNIPASVTTLGVAVFSGCPAMTSITVDPTNPAFSSIDGVLYDKTNTTIIQYPDGKVGAFTIPSTVISVGYAFAYAVGVTAINVDAGNQYYSSIGGVLFSKDNTTLYQYPLGRAGNYDIPEKTTTIYAYAFFHGDGLTALTVPINTTYFGTYAFKNCSHLSSVTFLGNVSYLYSQSFANCSSLGSISFYGTVAPAYVSYDWTSGGHDGLAGHALATSNFPAPGSVFYGLLMGSYLSSTPAVPGAPTGLAALTMSGSIVLNWTAPSDPGSGVANYLIYRGTSAGGEGSTPIAKVLGTSYSDTTGTAGTPYYYTVRANNTLGVGAASTEAHSTATSATVPSAPQNFQVTAGTNSVTLQWTAPASDGGSGILRYDIYRSDSGSWNFIGSVGATTLSYVDSNGSSGSGNQYYVAAINAIGKGTTTDPKSAGSGASNGSSSDNTPIFAGIGILAVIIVVVLLFLYMKRRK